MRPVRRLVAVVLGLCLLLANTAAGGSDAGTPLPTSLQLTLLGKVLSFDRSLAGRTKVLNIVVLYQADYPQSEAAKTEFMRAARSITKAGGSQFTYKAIQIEGKPNFRDVFNTVDASVVYVMPLRGLDVHALAEAAAAAGVRSFSGMPEYVYEGIAVTLGDKEGKPAVYVNLHTARAQGSDFSSQLLKLANVVD